MHISSPIDLDKLDRLNFHFRDVKNQIIKSESSDHLKMITWSHRFILSIQHYLHKILDDSSRLTDKQLKEWLEIEKNIGFEKIKKD